ncbi:MAG: hypothetical protein KatS3mg111_2429 [Pirellulaceae bacterium]|nr:MAG: hypothetical protein KatS3mg111_2429 [Pirellulaceae bacterium]
MDPMAAVKRALPNDRLREFAPMLDWVVQPTLPDVDAPLGPPPLTAEDLGIKVPVSDRAIPDIDWEERRRVEIAGLIFSDTIGVAHGINLWTHISGTPTVVDFAKLQAANFPLHRPMASIKLTDVSVEAAAQQVAHALGLESVVRENRYLLWQPPAAQIAATLPTELAVDDLISAEQAGELAMALETVSGGPPGRWRVGNGVVQRNAEQIRDHEWFLAVRLLESWRRTLGLPSRVPTYNPENLDARLPNVGEFIGSQHVLQQVAPQERPVGQLLSSVSAEAGVDCWIDWPNTMSQGMGPATEETVVTFRRPLYHVLREICERYDLVCCLLDRRSIWLTSPRGYRTQPQWFVVPVKDRTPEEIELSLIGLSPLSEDGVQRIRVVMVPGEQVAWVYCCRPRIEFP